MQIKKLLLGILRKVNNSHSLDYSQLADLVLVTLPDLNELPKKEFAIIHAACTNDP